MNGPEHYRAAEEHLGYASAETMPGVAAWHVGVAQVHAVLAHAAATAMAHSEYMRAGDCRLWEAAVSAEPMPEPIPQ